MKHAGSQEIQTSRLILRRFRVDDAGAMYRNWAGDPRVTRYLSWDAHPDETVTRHLLEVWEKDYEAHSRYLWAIEKTGELVGSIDLHNLKQNEKNCELGYCLGTNWWGMGIAGEAAEAVVDYIFTHTDMHRISAWYHADNRASGKVLRKIGMIREGTLRDHMLRADGTWADAHVCGMVRGDWESRNRAWQYLQNNAGEKRKANG